MSKNNNKLAALRVLVCCIIVLTSVQSNRVLADRQDMSVGSVVISELMPNIDDSAIDWIEFYNTTDTKQKQTQY